MWATDPRGGEEPLRMNSSCSRARGVNSESVVFFAEDIYGHDRTLGAALEQGYPYLTNG